MKNDVVRAFRLANTADLPPSRPKGASACLAGAFGVGGKVRTTHKSKRSSNK